ncbi:hypothetical protein ABZ698_39395, partial [Streptomyces antibioticus]
GGCRMSRIVYPARTPEAPRRPDWRTRAACLGDVSILRVTTPPATTPLPQAGHPVVRGEAGGNTHSLHAASDAGVCFTPADGRGDDLVLGMLTVPDGAEAYLLHPEHGGMAIAPGTYRIGRQREWAGTWRLVAD